MHSLDLLLLQDIACKEGEHQEHDHDKERPGAGNLLRARLGGICIPSHMSDHRVVKGSFLGGEGKGA